MNPQIRTGRLRSFLCSAEYSFCPFLSREHKIISVRKKEGPKGRSNLKLKDRFPVASPIFCTSTCPSLWLLSNFCPEKTALLCSSCSLELSEKDLAEDYLHTKWLLMGGNLLLGSVGSVRFSSRQELSSSMGVTLMLSAGSKIAFLPCRCFARGPCIFRVLPEWKGLKERCKQREAICPLLVFEITHTFGFCHPFRCTQCRGLAALSQGHFFKDADG